MVHKSIFILLSCAASYGAQLKLTALPGSLPYSVAALDAAGNVYIAGSTTAAIPLVNPIQSSLSAGNCSAEIANSFAPCDTAFLAKLDPTGTKILYSTYLGSSQRYIVSGLAVDAAGNAYVSGTASQPSPTSPPPSGNAFLFKVNTIGSALVYSLVIDASTSGNAVAVDAAGNAYLAGASFDAKFPSLGSSQTIPTAKDTFATNDGGVTWRAINLNDVTSLAIDPTITSTLYAVSGGAGLYKSIDSGATWTQLLAASVAVKRVLLDPQHPSTLYRFSSYPAPTQFAKSTDGGVTWQDLTSALPPSPVAGAPVGIGDIAIDPENTQTVWMAMNATAAPAIIRSKDGGVHWESVHSFPSIFAGTAANPGATGTGVFVDPTNSSRIYFCCAATLGASQLGLFRSDDGGANWVAGSPGFTSGPVLDPAHPSILYALAANGLVRSTDAGGTWTALPPSPALAHGSNLALDASGAVYQAFDYGTLLRSTDSGITWTASYGPWLQSASILALDPVRPSSTIYVGSLTPGGEHAFLAKLDPSGAYIWATVFGGSEIDSAQAVAVDGSGNAYVAGNTNSPDFPILNAFQPAKGGTPPGSSTGMRPGANTDGFVTRFSAAGQMVYSSFLGGSSNETVTSLAVSPAGDAYVAGYTASSDFPTVKPLQSSPGGGGATGFVSKINPTGGMLSYSTYVGGTDPWATSAVSTIALTPQGGLWVTGNTSSLDLPLVQPIQPSSGNFLAEINSSGSDWVFSSYISLNILSMAATSGDNLRLAAVGFTGLLDFGPPPTTPPGVPLILSVYNAASFQLSDSVSPGAAVTIFGEELATAAEAATTLPMPLTLQGASLTVAGIAAPLYYVSPGQINFQVPYGVPLGDATLVVTRGNQSTQRKLTIAAATPGIFTVSGAGNGQSYVVHASDYSLVTASSPAVPGEYLAIFCTGLGATSPPAAEGHPAPIATILATSYFVSLNSRVVTPSYAGLAPGYAGLYQVNFQVPANQPSGPTVLSLFVTPGSSQLVPLWTK